MPVSGAGVAGGDARVGRARLRQGLLAVDGDEGVEVRVEPLDAVEEERVSSTLEIFFCASGGGKFFEGGVDHRGGGWNRAAKAPGNYSITFGTR